MARSAFTAGFLQCYKTTRVHFMACVGINKTAWGAKLILTADLARLCQSGSPTDGTALPFVLECLL